MAAPEQRVPEVIVISDDESADEEAPSSNTMNSFSWTDVANRLLLMAKSRELRDDEQAMEMLLRDLGIEPTAQLQRFLHNTCEALGELMALSRGNNRRYRACEDLVLGVCEVLSLMQTATCTAMAPQDPWIKGEGAFVASNFDAIGYLYRQMDKWRLFVEELARSSDSRGYAIAATLSHLEKLNANIKQKIESLQETQTIYQ
ncbi:hypothetical protein V7S43_003477 [Phytophthora oleae]|uniref:Uncharacterized protein n=1 Tax=Phytophthora oleae TaxID=2107226 RepID=A0ABD3G0H1_9STRA